MSKIGRGNAMPELNQFDEPFAPLAIATVTKLVRFTEEVKIAQGGTDSVGRIIDEYIGAAIEKGEAIEALTIAFPGGEFPPQRGGAL